MYWKFGKEFIVEVAEKKIIVEEVVDDITVEEAKNFRVIFSYFVTKFLRTIKIDFHTEMLSELFVSFF